LLATQISLDIRFEMQSASADLLIWEPAISGTYFAKSAYTWLLDKDVGRLRRQFRTLLGIV
jgi:hypothetical protein